MIIDHIFIFSDEDGKEADELVNFGLKEGSSRIHPGQGTVNRKFYFNNFFLEILWVNNHEEIVASKMLDTKLWERADFKNNQLSPFGLCLVNEPDTKDLFENTLQYQPAYFPENMAIDVITNSDSPNLPWTFRLPFTGVSKKTDEPRDHLLPLNNLTKATFLFEDNLVNHAYVNRFNDEKQVVFKESDQNHLILEFDYHRFDGTKTFRSIPMTIKY